VYAEGELQSSKRGTLMVEAGDLDRPGIITLRHDAEATVWALLSNETPICGGGWRPVTGVPHGGLSHLL
jgi:hypothetical protein